VESKKNASKGTTRKENASAPAKAVMCRTNMVERGAGVVVVVCVCVGGGGGSR